MRVWRFLVTFALTVVLGTNTSLSASSAEAVELFRRGCLDHLPDFAGSEQAFNDLGFVPSRDFDECEAFRREFRGSSVVSGLRLKIHDAYSKSMPVLDVTDEDDIVPLIANVFADMSFLSFRHEINESGVTNVFWWSIGSLDVMVATFKVLNQHSITVLAGDLSKNRELEK